MHMASLRKVGVGAIVSSSCSAAALSAWAKVLKPNGTLAIWYYARPIFIDGDKEKCTMIFDKIVNHIYTNHLKDFGPTQTAFWKRTFEVMASWFDKVKFPEQDWKDEW